MKLDDLRKRFGLAPEGDASSPTKRNCIDCGRVVYGGPTRCTPCVTLLPPAPPPPKLALGDVMRIVKAIVPTEVLAQGLYDRELSPLFCEHANECPSVCPCDYPCYCHSRACRPPDAALEHKGTTAHAKKYLTHEIKEIMSRYAGMLINRDTIAEVEAELKRFLEHLVHQHPDYSCLEEVNVTADFNTLTRGLTVGFETTNEAAKSLLSEVVTK